MSDLDNMINQASDLEARMQALFGGASTAQPQPAQPGQPEPVKAAPAAAQVPKATSTITRSDPRWRVTYTWEFLALARSRDEIRRDVMPEYREWADVGGTCHVDVRRVNSPEDSNRPKQPESTDSYAEPRLWRVQLVHEFFQRSDPGDPDTHGFDPDGEMLNEAARHGLASPIITPFNPGDPLPAGCDTVAGWGLHDLVWAPVDAPEMTVAEAIEQTRGALARHQPLRRQESRPYTNRALATRSRSAAGGMLASLANAAVAALQQLLLLVIGFVMVTALGIGALWLVWLLFKASIEALLGI